MHTIIKNSRWLEMMDIGTTLGSMIAKLRLQIRQATWYIAITTPRVVKRLFDIMGSSIALLILLPLLILTGVLIRLHDGGSILYWQQRIGKWGIPFAFPKLRSMVPQADKAKSKLMNQNDHGNSVTFKLKRDPRITPIGKWIRKLSIDEFPQFWSVLIGEMSLVGPRPPLPGEVELYSTADRRRLDVKPGLTCTWQVSGRADIPFEKQVQLDLEYIEKQTFWLDLRLLIQTIPAVLSGRGAY